MGAITFSLDARLAQLFQHELGCDTFFESGGFEGDTVAVVESLFERVVSVELAPAYAKALRARFSKSRNVEIVENDSATVLEQLRPQLCNARALYWLDAHWCDASSVNSAIHQCPLLRELRALGRINEHSAVIIDDARLFLAPPLAPHAVTDWPTWSQISRVIEANSGASHDVMIVNDCVVVYPKSMHQAVTHFAQSAGVDWLTIADLSREHGVMKAAAADRLTLINELHATSKTASSAVNQTVGALQVQLSEKEAALVAIHQTASVSHAENRMLAKRLQTMQTDLEAKESVIQAMASASTQVDERFRSLGAAHELAHATLRERESFFAERMQVLQCDVETKAGVIEGMSSAATQMEARLRALAAANEMSNATLRERENVIAERLQVLQCDVETKAGVIEGMASAATQAEERMRALAEALETTRIELHQTQLEQQRTNAAAKEENARLKLDLSEQEHTAIRLHEQLAASRADDAARHRAAAARVAALEQQHHELRIFSAGLEAGLAARANVIGTAAGAFTEGGPQDATPLEPAARVLLVATARQWEQHAVEKEAVIQDLVKAVTAHQAAADRRAIATRLWRKSKASVLSAMKPKLGVLNQHPPIPLGDRTIITRRTLSAEQLPTISIVTPSFRQAHLIERTIASVVDQQYPKLQYFVQDGGSDDGTVAVLEKWSDRLTGWESKRDDGQSAAINLGFAKTTGDVMAWLNSDDLFMPGALSYVASYFHKHPDVDVLYGDRLLIDEDDALIGRWVLPGHSDAVLPWADFVPQETLFWRRSIWDRAGGTIDESFKFAMDWDLLLRFRRAGARFAHVPKYLGAFRIHASQKTSAAISDVGFKEMDRLRLREIGREVAHDEIRRAIMPFMARHIVADKLVKLR